MSKTVDQLVDAGINAADYKRLPKGHPKDVFLASIKPDKGEGLILIHEGNARIHVRTYPKLHQALLTVTEGARTLSRHVTVRAKARRGQKSPYQKQIRAEVGVETVAGVTWRLIDPTSSRRRGRWERSSEAGITTWRGTVQARIPAGSMNLLMGMDESHNFIAGVPGNPRTVLQAHDQLRKVSGEDPGTLKGVPRQGEWFFIPIDRSIELILPRLMELREANHRLDGGTHEAADWGGMTMAGGVRVEFARGRVRDRRQGHHRDVFLHGWHRVVRNNETRTIPQIGANRTRSWD